MWAVAGAVEQFQAGMLLQVPGDGAGVVDQVGPGVNPGWVDQRAWCFGAQSYRAFGTAAEYCVVPFEKVAPLPDHVSFEQGACLGIPGLTGHRAVFVGGAVTGKTILVQGAAGAVGQAPSGRGTTVGPLSTASAGLGAGRSASVILWRTPGCCCA